MALNFLKRTSNGNVSKSPVISVSLALIGYLIIICGAGIWYYMYVEDRRAYLTQRNFRILAEAGQNLSDAVEGHAQILMALANGITKKGENSVSISDVCKQLIDDSHFKKVTVNFVSNGKTTEVPCPESNILDVRIPVTKPEIDSILSQYKLKNSFAQTKFNLHLERTLHGARLTIHKEVPGECLDKNNTGQSVLWSQKSQKKKLKKSCSLQLAGVLDLDTLLERLPIEEIFADLLLAGSDGTVIYQKSSTKQSTSLKFQLLDILFQHKDSGYSVPTAERASQLPSNGKNEAQISRDNLLRQVPAKSRISFGDETFLFFTQPAYLPFPHLKIGSEDIVFILGGIVSSRTFQAHAMAIPTPILLPSVFAFFFLTFSLPLLKLWSMGSKDRLTIIDVVSLMFFSLMGTALLTFGLADLYAYSTAENKLDKGLEVVSKKIKDGFTQELRLILNELRKQDENYSSVFEICSEHKNRGIVRPDFLEYYWMTDNPILESCRNVTTIEKKKILNGIREVKAKRKVSQEYPYFNGLFWITSGGEVENYFTVAKAGINSPNLKERPYVQRVLNKRLYNLKSGDNQKTYPPFFIQPIYSWTSGKNEVVISIESTMHTRSPAVTKKGIWTQSAEGKGNSTNPHEVTNISYPHIAVAAMESKLLSLMYPVVPPGFGYSIIDDNGKVLFHSDLKKNLRENIFSETNQDRRLRSLVLARNADHTNVRYAGNDSQFFVTPIGTKNLDLPWTLIVYRDMNLLRTANGIALFISTVLFALYAIVILGVGFFGFLIVGDLKSGQAAWMWPDKKYHKRYTAIALINSGLVLVFGVLMLNGNGQANLLRAMAFAFIGMSAMYLILNNKPPLKVIPAGRFPVGQQVQSSKWQQISDWCSPQSYTTSYTWMVMTFMLVFSAVPSLSIFMVAFDEEMLLLRQYVNRSLAQSLEQRKLDIEHFYMGGNFGKKETELTENLLNNGSKLGIDIHEIFWPAPSFENISKPEPPKEDYKKTIIHEDSGVFGTSHVQSNLWPNKLWKKLAEYIKQIKKDESDHFLIEWLHEQLRPFYNDSSEHTGGFLPPLSEASASNDINSSILTFSRDRHAHMGLALILVALCTMCVGVLDNVRRIQTVLNRLSFAIAVALVFFAIVPNTLVHQLKGVDGKIGMVWAILLLVFLFALYRLPNFISQRIFYLGYRKPDESQMQLLDGAKNQDLVIRLQSPVFLHPLDKVFKSGLLKQLRAHTTTQRRVSFFRNLPLFQPHIEFIDPLTHMGEDQDKNIRILQRLERYHLIGRKVWLVSPIDLLNWSYSQFSGDPNSTLTRDCRERWVKVLGKFQTVFYIPEKEQREQEEFEELVSENALKAKLSDEQIKLFTDECKVSPEHRKYGAALLQDKKQLIQMMSCPQATEKFPAFMLDALAIKYRAWWSICSEAEKLALYHLATDRFLNSQNPSVRTLLQKNLIRLAPDLQMINESFRQFILTICEKEEISLLERTGPTSGWKKLVWPMGGFIILLAIFLISTQQDFRAIVLAFIPVLPALFGILMKRLGSSPSQGTTSTGEA